MINLMKGDCLEVMKEIESGSVDMVLTSPPYDNLRDYGKDFKGWGDHIWKPCLDEIYRTLKEGGVCVWIVADATIKGSETGTSFRQALFAIDCGFNLHDTMIWRKPDAKPLTHKRYEQSFEYMFIFSKGKPLTFNGIKDKPNKWAGTSEHGTWRDKDGSTKRKSGHNRKIISDYGLRHNVWDVNTVKNNKNGHPAPFPKKLTINHIQSWSNEGDTILDTFMGSGTTGVACKNLNRSFIGIEIDDKYFEIAKERINKETRQQELF
jgi:site-specific DNA-methyltransferase (adenine-specific)